MSNTTEAPMTPNDIPTEAPLQVNSLRILGTTATRNSFLNSVTSPVFNASTTEDVLKRVQAIAAQLQKHEIFEEIKIYLDTNHDIPDTVDITLHLKEKDKGLFQTKVNMGNNQAELNGGVGLRNIFGGAEAVYANFSFGNRTRAAIEGIFETPFRGNANTKIGLFVNGSIRDHSQINAFKESSKATGIRFKGWTDYGKHEVAYAITHRDVLALSSASSTVRSQSGGNSKTSVFHSFVRDHRDDIVLPTRGHYIGVFQELAGLGDRGDSNFLKHELNASYHLPLIEEGENESNKLIFSSSIRAGLFSTLFEGKKGGPTVSDRFYLGGPQSVRGFKMGGIGERDGNDALGGEAYWAAGASLISPIPGLSHLPVKAHAFVNAGNIVTSTKNVHLGDTVKALSESSRSSVGFGFIFHHSLARIEANYCIPVRYTASDLPEPKFQFGFGLNFL
ncbi:surface antigen-domain-containing protein [Cokeromyces recurvatus]|uniref:surface antigen-domain-containing protein n=1 Tax=Cokeromyces recurvatus TaxID=90255 RepID=UPI00221FE244|nr:surface antigen-domain-containing protein [Cokeromyces recurvatus]KAI7901209.1 surface antigen-domain-containing protein [Cokeromyces recurvatus]